MLDMQMSSISFYLLLSPSTFFYIPPLGEVRRGLSILQPFNPSYGTGSYPLPPHGWHLSNLLTASHSPFIGPCFTSACRAYSEQVGVKRHEGGVSGEMHL